MLGNLKGGCLDVQQSDNSTEDEALPTFKSSKDSKTHKTAFGEKTFRQKEVSFTENFPGVLHTFIYADLCTESNFAGIRLLAEDPSSSVRAA